MTFEAAKPFGGCDVSLPIGTRHDRADSCTLALGKMVQDVLEHRALHQLRPRIDEQIHEGQMALGGWIDFARLIDSAKLSPLSNFNNYRDIPDD